MKHPSNREFYGYWDRMRGEADAPDRNAFDPEPVRHLLGDIFVLSVDTHHGHPVRVAGTKVCALAGCDLKQKPFTSLFARASIGDITSLIEQVADEKLPVIAGLTATSAADLPYPLELLLLPFAMKPHAPISLTGLLAPFAPAGQISGPIHLTSWRHIESIPNAGGPRTLQKRAAASGFVVYEGIR